MVTDTTNLDFAVVDRVLNGTPALQPSEFCHHRGKCRRNKSMYSKPHVLMDCLIDFRAASYDEFEANLEVKWISSRVRPVLFASLDRNAIMACPDSLSL